MIKDIDSNVRGRIPERVPSLCMERKYMKLIQATTPYHWLRFCLLYRRAFPRSERKPVSIIRKMQKKGTTDVWYLEQDGRFAGLAATINGENIILVDYLAIDDKRRGHGDGSKALKKLRQQYAGKGVFVEIECLYEDADNYEERHRRKQFYLRNGMMEMHTTAKLFGVDMELLGYDCQLSYEEYREFYQANYGEWAASHITPAGK